MLADFATYPEWNPFMRRIVGEPVIGARLVLHVQPDTGPALKFKTKVIRAEPGRELSWIGSLYVPRLLNGEHIQLLEPVGNGHVHLIHEEHFTGVLVPLLPRSLAEATRRGFEAMNQALKERLEAPK